MQSEPAPAVPAPSARPVAFIFRGALGFTAVSLAAFAVWAFAARWFRRHGGEVGLYAAVAAVFVLLTGLLLHPLVLGSHRLLRFYSAFAPAFIAYSLVWSALWFWLKSGPGEWLGGLLGSLAFVALVMWRLGQWRGFGRTAAVFIVLHQAGYIVGGQSMAWLLAVSRQEPVPFLDSPTLLVLAKLSWGLFYGIGFGAGLGYVFAASQRNPSTAVFPLPTSTVNPSRP